MKGGDVEAERFDALCAAVTDVDDEKFEAAVPRWHGGNDSDCGSFGFLYLVRHDRRLMTLEFFWHPVHRYPQFGGKTGIQACADFCGVGIDDADALFNTAHAPPELPKEAVLDNIRRVAARKPAIPYSEQEFATVVVLRAAKAR